MSLSRHQLLGPTTGQGDRARDHSAGVEATGDLYYRARAGDQSAWTELVDKYKAVLLRFAHGRLPTHARGTTDTWDIVQDVMIRVIPRLDGFEFRHQGALLAYLRRAVSNRVLDVGRRAQRQPVVVSLVDDHADPSDSPLQRAIGLENTARYRAAIGRLPRRDRLVILLRLEGRLSYEELAVQLGMPSANAARLAAIRAVRRLAKLMAEDALPH